MASWGLRDHSGAGGALPCVKNGPFTSREAECAGKDTTKTKGNSICLLAFSGG